MEVDDDDRNVDGLENVLKLPFQGECKELGELWKGIWFCTEGNDEKCWVGTVDGTDEWNVKD